MPVSRGTRTSRKPSRMSAFGTKRTLASISSFCRKIAAYSSVPMSAFGTKRKFRHAQRFGTESTSILFIPIRGLPAPQTVAAQQPTTVIWGPAMDRRQSISIYGQVPITAMALALGIYTDTVPMTITYQIIFSLSRRSLNWRNVACAKSPSERGRHSRRRPLSSQMGGRP